MNYSNTRLAYSNLVLGYLSDYPRTTILFYFPFPSHNFLPLLYEKHEIFVLVINKRFGRAFKSFETDRFKSDDQP